MPDFGPSCKLGHESHTRAGSMEDRMRKKKKRTANVGSAGNFFNFLDFVFIAAGAHFLFPYVLPVAFPGPRNSFPLYTCFSCYPRNRGFFSNLTYDLMRR